jgi:hypothetical protein
MAATGRASMRSKAFARHPCCSRASRTVLRLTNGQPLTAARVPLAHHATRWHRPRKRRRGGGTQCAAHRLATRAHDRLRRPAAQGLPGRGRFVARRTMSGAGPSADGRTVKDAIQRVQRASSRPALFHRRHDHRLGSMTIAPRPHRPRLRRVASLRGAAAR